MAQSRHPACSWSQYTKFPFPTLFPPRLLSGLWEGRGLGLSCLPSRDTGHGTRDTGHATPSPLPRSPTPSGRQPRASRAQSGGIALNKPRGRWRGVPGGPESSASPPLRVCAPGGPGPPSARPAPACAGQSLASSRSICIRPPRLPRPAACRRHTQRPWDLPRPLPKRLLCAEAGAALSPRLSPNQTWG